MPSGPAPGGGVPAVAGDSAAPGDDAFGADIFGRLPAAGNLVFSPVSIAAALRLVLLGARGETAAQIAAALHLASPDDALPGLQAVSALLGELAAGDLTLRAPNTVWAQSGLLLEPGFTAALAAAPAVALRGADFRQAADQARQEINQFIAEQTAGKITGLLSPGVLDAATRLVLASAVYLKAAWAHPFPAGATQDSPFYPDPGTQVTATTMRVRARLRYLRGDGYQAVELPYAGTRLAMVIVLPDGPPGPGSAEPAGGPEGPAGLLARDAQPGGLRGLLAGLAPRQVSLALPRFTVTSGFGLRPVLAGLGMAQAFSADADFSGITTAQRLRIDEVVHQAYIDVNEEGTEAAAATAVVATAMARFVGEPPVELIVDRPFLFAITDPRSGLPLFLGRVTNPTAA
ncbi:MAG TPA: serpin family protein [Streptosporangiaceae bacterium]